MSFVDAVKSVLTQYCTFSGRARRSEYWYFVLFNFIIGMVASVIGRAVGSNILSIVVSIALFLPGLAVAVRRLHDIGKSGWWLFISLVPFVGAILLFIWVIKDSDPGENQFGPNPKEA